MSDVVAVENLVKKHQELKKEIAKVTADGAYDTRRCHNVIAARGAAAVRQGKGPPHPFRTFLTPSA